MKYSKKILILLLVFAACKRNAPDEKLILTEDTMVQIDATYQMDATGGEGKTFSRQALSVATPMHEENVYEEVNKKQLIKDGRMGIKADDLNKTRTMTDSLVGLHAAYYANERYFDTETESTYHLTIRIPAGNFEHFITGVESGAGRILYKEIDARDVTEQFIDLESRLLSKLNYLTRYRELLQQAKTVKDILDIEDRIRVIEEEIESTEGRLRYLKDQVSYSTLNLMISQEKEFRFIPEKKDKFLERVKQSIEKGWSRSIDIVLLMVQTWPLWLLLIIVAMIIRMYVKRKNN
jgi:hypothetical protein